MTGHCFDFVLAYRFTAYGLQRVLARENKLSITDYKYDMSGVKSVLTLASEMRSPILTRYPRKRLGKNSNFCDRISTFKPQFEHRLSNTNGQIMIG